MNPEINPPTTETTVHNADFGHASQVILPPVSKDIAPLPNQLGVGRWLNWIIFGACAIVFGGGYLLFGAKITVKLEGFPTVW